MPRTPSSVPTEVELQILRVLWDNGPKPVREIHAHLSAAKGTNYSTTVKMLAVMLEKSLVTRKESCRPHVYSAAITREKAGKRMLSDLADKVYNGSAFSLALQALGASKGVKGRARQSSPNPG